MAFNITDNSEIDIYINDGWRDWYIPKFRLYWEIDEPTITLYWNDLEKGKSGILRKIVLDYTDVQFGYLTPTSASEVGIVLQSYITSAWDNIINQLGNYVPYTGATQNVDLGTYGLTADFVAFDLNPINAPGAGQIAYDGSTGSLTYLLNNSSVESHIGQTLHAYVHNAEGSPIYKGDAVYLYQASGNKGSVKLARNLSDSTSAKTFGLCAEDIGTGQNGMVICQGQLKGVDTSMFSEGDTLYLANTYGDLTNVKPYAPEHLVYIGVVEKANANGEIYVRVQNGYELNEIHDVDLITTPPINGDVLTYNGSLWVAQAPTGGSGITSLNSQTGTTQTFATGSSGTDFNIASATNTHTFNIPTASATNRGLLSTTDWSTFNAKEPALTKGNLTEATSSVLTISGGTNAVIGSGTSIQVKQANGSQSGFLATADWTTFNSKFTLPALTSGSVLFSNGTTIAQDNANLFWDDANNRLGIGTNAPANNFVIQSATPFQQIRSTQTSGNGEGGLFITTWNGSAIASVGAFGGTNSTYSSGDISSNGIYITSDRAGGMHFIARSTGTIKFYTAGENLANRRMNIFNNGNVAIGINTDGGFKLDVNGTAQIQGDVTIVALSPFQQIRSTQTTGNGEAGLYFSTYNGSSVVACGGFGGTSSTYSFEDISANGVYLNSSRAGGLHIIARSTGTIKFYTGGQLLANRRMNIFNNGNISIGTNTDGGFKLDVNGTVRFQGDLTIDTKNIITDTTTGSKIGTATTQKIGFWNATPIVQPTTAVAGATFAAVAGGTTIDTNDTFDGYTVGQVVKALRNLGILA